MSFLDRAPDPPGHAEHQGAGWDDHVFNQHRGRPDKAVLSDLYAVVDRGAASYQDPVADLPRVAKDPVADDNTVPMATSASPCTTELS